MQDNDLFSLEIHGPKGRLKPIWNKTGYFVEMNAYDQFVVFLNNNTDLSCTASVLMNGRENIFAHIDPCSIFSFKPSYISQNNSVLEVIFAVERSNSIEKWTDQLQQIVDQYKRKLYMEGKHVDCPIVSNVKHDNKNILFKLKLSICTKERNSTLI